MIERPELRMEVVVNNSDDCCEGLPAGTIGYIKQIENNDQFLVSDRSSENEFWHCTRCVSKFK